MKLLIVTQKVDWTDSDLGFFHNWLIKIAQRVEWVYVICLQKGASALPHNVTVLSLGKEEGVSTFKYLTRLYGYTWRLRKEYDHVWVHMNPEYVVLVGWLWRVWHKKVALWYLHKSITPSLRIAEKIVNRIFTASVESFRLPSKKVQVTGHGIDVFEFEKVPVVVADSELKLVSIGRISASKDHKLIITAVAELQKIRPDRKVFLEIVGAPITAADQKYLGVLQDYSKELHLDQMVTFVGGVDQAGVVASLARNQIMVHASVTGSMDKVVLEALAAGRLVVSSSAAYPEAVALGAVHSFIPGDAHNLAQVIDSLVVQNNAAGRVYVKEHHNLEVLIEKIITYFT